MAEADPNLKDRLLNELTSSLTPATEGIASELPAPGPPVIPDHTLFRCIGRGSYGEVWLARNALGTWRAVKIVHRRAFDSERPYEREFAGIRRFEPISRTHPSQLNVLHVGRDDAAGLFYYVMELADDAAEPFLQREDGRSKMEDDISATDSPRHSPSSILNPRDYQPRTLRSDLHHRGRLPCDECLRLGLALATALDHLHRHGLVHRDIKPSNIVFVNGIPKLADIGLVTHVEATISFVGTEGYLPPEGPGTAQADIYSLGKVLYEMATGRDRQDYPELPTNLIEVPAADRAALSELNEVIVKACHNDARQRYQTAAELHADLALLQSGASVRRQRLLARRLRFVQRAGAVVTAIAALIAAGWLWQTRQTHKVRELATEKTTLADKLARLDAENRNRIVRLDIANGVRLLDEGDPGGALLWFADALSLLTNNPAEESIHRIRIQQTLDQTPRVLRVFPHDSGVESATFSPDGQRIATGTRDGELQVWDTDNRQRVWGPKRCEAPVACVRFSPGGELLFASSSAQQGIFNGALPQYNFLAVVDAHSGRELFSANEALPGMLTNLICSTYSPDGRWIAAAHKDLGIYVLDSRNGRRVAELRGHTAEVKFLSFTADGSLLASASLDKTVRVWRMPSGEPVGLPLEHRWPVVRAQLTEHGRYLISAANENPGDDGGIEVNAWHLSSSRRVAGPLRPRDRISLFAAPELQGTFFVQDRAPNRLRAYYLATGEASPACPEARGILSWCYSPDGSQLALGNNDHLAQVYDVWTGAAMTPPFRHGSWGVTAVEFSPDQQSLLTACEDGNARVWDLWKKPAAESAQVALASWLKASSTLSSRQMLGRSVGGAPIPLGDGTVTVIDDQLRELHRFTPHKPGLEVTGPLSTPNGQHWVIPNFDKSSRELAELVLWSQSEAEARETPLPHPVPIFDFAFTPDSQHVVTLGADDQVRFWRTSDGNLERTVKLQGDGQIACINAQSSTCLVRLTFSSDEGTEAVYRFLDLDSGAVIGETQRLPTTDFDLVFSPDGKRVALLDELGPVTILETRTARLITSKIRHKAKLKWAQWDLAGRRLLTVGHNDEVLIWNAETGEQLLGPLRTAGSGIRLARWSPDGRFIITNGNDHKVRVWDATTGECVTPAWQHPDFVGPFFMTKDNRVITATYANNALRAWDLKETTLPQDVLADYARLLSGRHLSAAGAMLVMKPEELAKLDDSLHATHPEFFRKSVEELREWQHQQVPEPTTVARIRSGLLRLERMAELDPGDAWVKEQLARFRACQVPPRAPGTPANLVDLSDFYTHSFCGLRVSVLLTPSGHG